MEYFTYKCRSGGIDFKTHIKTWKIGNHLEENGHEIIGSINDGSYSLVLKVKHLELHKELDANVVEKKYSSDIEINMWKALQEENILQLSDMQFAYYANPYIFLLLYMLKD